MKWIWLMASLDCLHTLHRCASCSESSSGIYVSTSTTSTTSSSSHSKTITNSITCDTNNVHDDASANDAGIVETTRLFFDLVNCCRRGRFDRRPIRDGLRGQSLAVLPIRPRLNGSAGRTDGRATDADPGQKSEAVSPRSDERGGFVLVGQHRLQRARRARSHLFEVSAGLRPEWPSRRW